MGRCAILKFGRKEKKMTQKEFADAAGVSLSTICRLEMDESAWLTVRPETEEKIQSLLDGTNRWRVENLNNNKVKDNDNSNTDEKVNLVPIGQITQEMIEQATKQSESKKNTYNGLSENDVRTLDLIEFAYEGLLDAKSHEEFAANINIIKRIINKY